MEVLCAHEANNKASAHIKQKLTKQKGEGKKSILISEKFSIAFSKTYF
jgi:hypothetical protein